MSKIKVAVSIVTTTSVMMEVEAENYDAAVERIKERWSNETLDIDTQMAQEDTELVFG